jgi:conjugal transfer mating pair stabilization protein TraG
MDPKDRDVMVRTLAAEAGGEPPAGQAAVAHTILNRVADGGYGQGVAGVIQKPGEFSSWNGVTGFAHGKEASKLVTAPPSQIPNYTQLGNLVDQVYSGQIPDPTNGATHYYAPRSMATGRPPPWAGPLAAQNSVKVGSQIFVGGSMGPGQAIPNQVTGGYQDIGAMSG